MASKVVICTVPDERKSEAAKNTLEGEINAKCPASILRTHQNADLVSDKFAAIKLNIS